jgi:hypothetical protein
MGAVFDVQQGVPGEARPSRKEAIMKWKRHRFTTKAGDFRPTVFNKSYPWWKSGETCDDGHAIIVAYLPADEPLEKYWDDAFDRTSQDCDDVTFTDRFPKPSYYVPLEES